MQRNRILSKSKERQVLRGLLKPCIQGKARSHGMSDGKRVILKETIPRS